MGTYNPPTLARPLEKSSSIIDTQSESILAAIEQAGRGEWKVLVLDESSSKLVFNVVTEDEILKRRITYIQQIEHRRATDRDTEAIYLLTPEPHVVDCLVADLERRRYKRVSVLWTLRLPPALRVQIDNVTTAKEQITELRSIDVAYYPRESNLITFRDPWSFPVLFHPSCNHLVRQHLQDMAQRIVSVCVALGEYPTIRYYRPATATHDAAVLCSHLAGFVQADIDMYATYHKDFPLPSARPRAVLFIVDRSMDLIAPLLHEFTYQAMIHDLLPVKEGDKITYKITVNEEHGTQQEKDMEITEKDQVWLTNRHRHMKDTIETVMGDFQKFMANDAIAAQRGSSNNISLSTLKDMMVGMGGFEGKKDAFSLHLTMAQECMNLFERRKLPDLASLEQTLATRLDEEFRKPKNVADQVVRALDEDAIGPPDRLRLLLLYLLYRDGLLPADITKLLAHAQLEPPKGEVVGNLGLLGVHVSRGLKDSRPPKSPVLVPPQVKTAQTEEYSLSRYVPILKLMLQESSRGTLNQDSFPYTKPQLEPADGIENATHSSLRSAKPTWASRKTGGSTETNQRVFVFMAGGATYSESRTCYEASRELRKDVYLLTSHMLTPGLFMRQVGDLSVDRRRLGIPAEQPKPKAPAHLFEQEQPAPVAPPQAAVSRPSAQPQGMGARPNQGLPTTQMQSMNLAPNHVNSNGSRPSSSTGKASAPPQEKKKRHFFSSKK